MRDGNRSLDILSIIIPIYKKTKNLNFLKTTIRNAKNKSLPVEFILVQDGENAELENELQAFSKELTLVYAKVDHSSPGLTRNEGIQIARAQWITFWDCDDVGNVEVILEAIESAGEKYNVLIGNYYIHDLRTNSLKYYRNRTNNLERLMISPGIWRFVFRKSLIGNTRFDRFRMGEDQLFLCKLRIDETFIKYVDKNFYTYNINVAEQLTSQPEAVSDLAPAIRELTSLTMNDSGKFSYIYVVQIKLMMTAIKNGKYSMHDFSEFLFVRRKGQLRFVRNICRGLAKVAVALFLRNAQLR